MRRIHEHLSNMELNLKHMQHPMIPTKDCKCHINSPYNGGDTFGLTHLVVIVDKPTHLKITFHTSILPICIIAMGEHCKKNFSVDTIILKQTLMMVIWFYLDCDEHLFVDIVY